MPWANEFDIVRYSDGAFSQAKDLVVEECRVEIYVNGRPYASVMATPDKLDYLAIGCLFSEGALRTPADIKSLDVRGLDVWVELYGPTPEAPPRARASGFGLGSVNIRDLESPEPVRLSPPVIEAARIVELMEQFNQMSELFRQTGAVHSAWLVRGEDSCFAEDVGRHNALDKVIGQYLSAGEARPAQPALLLTTGRISAEMILKPAKAGLAAVISRSAATDRAIHLARKLNIIMIGFARPGRFNVYHGQEFIRR